MVTTNSSLAHYVGTASHLRFVESSASFGPVALDDIDPIAQDTFRNLARERFQHGGPLVLVQAATYLPGTPLFRRTYEGRGWADYVADASCLTFPGGVRDPVSRQEVDHLFIFVLDGRKQPPRLSLLATLLEPRPTSWSHFAAMGLLDLVSSSPARQLAGALCLAGAAVPVAAIPRAAADRSLLLATLCGQTPAALSALAAGADIEGAGVQGGMSSLAWAAYLGHCGLARALIARGANCLPQASDSRQSPLHSAFLWRDVGLQRQLLARGASATLALPDAGPAGSIDGDDDDDEHSFIGRSDSNSYSNGERPRRLAASMCAESCQDPLFAWAVAWQGSDQRQPAPSPRLRRLWAPVAAQAAAVLARRPTAED